MDDPSRSSAQNSRIHSGCAVATGSTPVKHLTNAETLYLDNQASDADDEADSFCAESDTSSITESAAPSPNSGDLHKLMAKAAFGKHARADAAPPQAGQPGEPPGETDRERFMRLLESPSSGPPFRAPMAVMYMTDGSGSYIPDDDASAKRQKLLDYLDKEQQVTPQEEYVNVATKGEVKSGVKDGEQDIGMADSDDGVGSSAVVLEGESSKDEASESDGFTKVDKS
ncbi:hypothetical protein FGG08_005728 [Glutinoglossum americanum]|uniref:Uncharacterized protein n=1 Tax=Glutinoglossum americanum TaxID=1670608 RepID=A0A9P8I307_9PEZI|nr:hypothetical protein FGG08_005728 [Glutinoglossum americanum]